MIFADSSGFIAAFDASDARHAAAASVWRELAEHGEGLVTTQLVVAETVTCLRRRVGWEISRRVGDAILASRAIEVRGLDDEQFAAAWREFVRCGDPELSLCDAASFVLMRELGVRRALTFDQHFLSAGFEVLDPAAGWAGS
jgi:uncharacterized protein